MRRPHLLATTLALILLFGATAEVPASGAHTGLSLAQITRHLAGYFKLSQSSPVNGQVRYMGMTDDKLALLELIGDESDLTQATLGIGVPNDSPAVLARNSAMYVRFVKNAFPGWTDAERWAVAALKKTSAIQQPVSTVRGARRVTVTFLKPLAMVMVTVAHK